MIRRSFRIGLWLGLLAGIAFALAKIFRPKPEPGAVIDLGTPPTPAAGHAPPQWPPLEAAVPTPTPVPVAEPDIEPVVEATEPGLVTIGDEPLQAEELPTLAPEPVVAPAPVVEPAPLPQPQAPPTPPTAAPEPVQQAAVKKTAVRKKAAPVAKAAASPAPAKATPAKKAPAPVKKAAAPAKKAAPKKTLPPWVDPKGNICPKSHPVKAKLSSTIFQAPGNFAYDRTNPDRCYESTEAAIKDGLRAAKR